jgi:hypothetical protein
MVKQERKTSKQLQPGARTGDGLGHTRACTIKRRLGFSLFIYFYYFSRKLFRVFLPYSLFMVSVLLEYIHLFISDAK